MSGRKGATIWVCAIVIFAVVTLSGGVGFGTSAAAVNAEFQVTDASLEEEAIVEGETVTITATVENVGSETGMFTAELESDADGVISTTDIEVEPGETEDVAFTEPFDTAGTYQLSVNGVTAGTLEVSEPASAEFDVTQVELSATEITVGDAVDVTAEIVNTGDADGTYTADLVINDTVEESKQVDINAGETAEASFTESFNTADNYMISVGDGPTEKLSVVEPEPANISVTDAELSPTRIDPGESVTVTATVVNDGGSADEFTVNLQEDGTTRDSVTRTVDAGEQTTIEFTPSFSEAGSYPIAVNDKSAGTLTVTEPAAFEVSNAQLDNETILAGDTAGVSAEVTNTGDSEGPFTAELRATDQDGTTETVDTQSVSLAGGASQTVELGGAVEQPGEYEMQINQTAAGTLTVESPADVAVTGASLNEDVVSERDDVTVTATIENTGDREGSLSVAVAADNEVKTTEEVTVGPGESSTEQLTYTATAAGESEITVNDVSAGTLTVVQPATFRTTNADVVPETVLEGESAEVTATVVNVGTESGTHTATLIVDGESVESQELDIGPGDSETAVFSPTFETADEYAIAVNNETAGTLTVLKPADISIRDTSLSSDTITVGESATVTVELANDGDVDGEFATELRDGSNTLETDTRTVGPDATETIRFNQTFETTGDYDLTVNNDSLGTLAVLEPADVSLGETTVAPESVEVNESVELTVELRNDGEATGQQEINIAFGDGTTIQRTLDVPESGTTLTFSDAYNATGEYTVVVNDRTVGNVTVADPQDDDGSGSAGGGGGGAPGSSGSSGSSGSTGSATAGSSEPTVLRSESDEAVTVNVDGMDGEHYEIPVELVGPSAAQPAVSISSLALDPAGDRDAFEVIIGQPTAEPDGHDPVPYGTALGYVAINSSLDADNTDAATLQFAVDQEAIPQRLSSEDVAVLRYADGEWTMANITHEGDDHTVTLPHAGPIAVVALEPGAVDIVDGEVPADRVRAGHETTVRATVTNPGDRQATRTLAASMHGETVVEREVSLDPRENTTVEIVFEPREGGPVSLEGDEVGSIEVFGDADGDSASTESESDDGVPGFGVAVTVLALFVAVLAVRIRR